MNKSTLSITLISTLVLSNCAKIKEYRKDPSERGKRERRSMTIENSPFPNKLRTGTVAQKQPTFTPITPAVQPLPNTVAPTAIQPITQSAPAAITPARVTHGFIEPDITGLPNSVDLQESDNVAPLIEPLPTPLPAPEPIIRQDVAPLVPSLAPLLDDPNDGLIPPP